MKSYYLIPFIALMLLACAKQEEDPQAKLAELKKQQSEINAEIKKLELSIAKSGKGAVRKQVMVVAMDIAPKPFNHFLEVQGKVISDKNVIIAAKAAGTIQRIYVKRGQKVAKGQLLATIDAGQLEKGMDELKTSMELANTLYEKQKSLWDQKIGTEIQYLQAKNTKESLDRKLATFQEQLDAFRIKATISGTVDEIFPNEGEIAAPGSPTFRIINGSSLKAVAEIAESYTSKISRGDHVELYFPDLDLKTQAQVSTVSDFINPVNRTFSTEVNLPSNPKYKTNMICYFKIRDYKNKSAIVIPINTIQHYGEEDYVYIAQNGKAVKRIVKTGKTYRDEVEIIEGLAEGDKLITVGYQEITDGQAIKL